MRKSIYIFLAVIFCTGIIWFYNINSKEIVIGKENNIEAGQESIAKKIIRFHVLANSDSNEDQALKLKVRDKVLEFIAPKMSECKSLEESREVLKNYDVEIKRLAEDVIRQSGYNYDVKTELSIVQFPIKKYGDIVLPEGQYEAYRILIGKAQGHNWWCVMFPPLCFTDITKGDVAVQKTDSEMKSVLTPEEYRIVNKSQKNDKKKVIVRSKIVEDINSLINKIEKKLPKASEKKKS